jgi:hypothetical protein
MMTSSMHFCVASLTYMLYNLIYKQTCNYIIFCPPDCVTILFHVFCQYTTFKIALIIYVAIL